ncbi:MAG: PhnD/SsuA/transferrin family substrate-binding protein [Thiomicrorhabdus sp.]|nr:PhnD/SsuA/transferrin family substrate-binding protein [Thiomicrorhabdus sp.]
MKSSFVTKIQQNIQILAISLGFSMGIVASVEAQETLVFAPLPKESEVATITRSLPLANEMARILDRKVTVKYYKNYHEIIQAYLAGAVDIVQLGPLNYIALHKVAAGLQPIVSIRAAKNQQSYRCVLVAPLDGLAQLDEIKQIAAPKVLLTQPLSTCGWMAAEAFFADAGLTLSDYAYQSEGAHDRVALALLRNEGSIGCMADFIAERFQGLGLEVLKEGPLNPMFALISNPKKLLPTELQKLQTQLLGLSAEKLQTLGVGKFGFVVFDQQQMTQFTDRVEKLATKNEQLSELQLLDVTP